MAQHADSEPAPHNRAATIADVDAAVDELAQATKRSFDRVEQRFNQIDQRFDKVDGRLASLERSQSAILDVLKSIDEHNRTMRDIPERVVRLEDAVFRR